MADREKVVDGLTDLKRFLPSTMWEPINDAIAILKEQDERYKNMVLSWLREIAINNVDCNRDMTFLDAVEDIRDRASYGLKQYFIDKQEGR